MKKNKAIILLLVFVLLLAGLGYTATVGLGVDGSGSAGSINLGLDLEGGVSITYQVVGDEKPSSEDMSDTIYKLQQRVDGYSTESVVYQEGDDRINIEIPGVSDANAILEELGKPGSLYFIRQTDSDDELVFTHAAEGADKILGHIFPFGARRNAAVGIAFRFGVNIAAYGTYILRHSVQVSFNHSKTLLGNCL